ncbi:DUF3999 family protein [Silanimonas sp.]|jgi:hypothetical protein|uniref:DUF3999 family protein n=1 Tax=Silanimonas sp. TaxID=1929290 RepID=UPI0022C82309|nr:DUF3999 family protein [Silanimonas sp.]MCZ8113678.1 DUF3999 family protein [Silanimonas sp.]
MTRHAVRSLVLAMAAAVSAAPVLGSDADFALAFPIDAPADAPVFAIDLPAEAYATLTSADLADLVVVDAQGREQPISIDRPAPPRPPEAPEAIELALPIAVPVEATSEPGGLELHVRRDAEGALTALDLRSADGMAAGSAPAEWLVDIGAAAREGLDGLRLRPQGDTDFRTRVDIRGSDDLVHWQDLQSALPVLRASSDGRRIERLDLRFARTTHRYLALRPVAGEAGLPKVAALEGLRSRAAEPAPLASVVLEATVVSEDGQNLEFGRIGPLPVQQAEVQLMSGDGIVDYRIEEQIGERWQPVASGTAWRLSIGGETLEATPTALWRSGMGPLRLRLAQATPPPRLVLGYAPDHVVVMANGTPPFRLLAGSARQHRVPVGLEDTLSAIRERQGPDWQPPLAAVGPPHSSGGAAALEPRADLGRWALWAVLGLGALVVGGLAWRVLRAAPPSE